MKKLIALLALVFHLPVATHAGDNKHVDTATWVGHVESLRNLRNDILGCEAYDAKLVREYFLHVKPQDDIEDLQWITLGLTAYGETKDMPILEKFVKKLALLGEGRTTNREIELLEAFKFIPLARGADQKAMKKILSFNGEDAVFLLRLVRTFEARDALAKIASDDKESFSVRCKAIESLKQLGDNRAIEITLTPNFIKTLLESDGYLPKFMSELTGKEDGEIESLTSFEKAQDWVKKNNFKIKPPEEKISVKGGVDWSKMK